MPMDELLALGAGQRTVGHDLHLVSVSSELHQRLRARMAETGECKVPVCVQGGRLRDGLHRVRLAHELAFAALPVTDDMAEGEFYRQRELV
jgi:hypothetical protein